MFIQSLCKYKLYCSNSSDSTHEIKYKPPIISTHFDFVTAVLYNYCPLHYMARPCYIMQPIDLKRRLYFQRTYDQSSMVYFSLIKHLFRSLQRPTATLPSLNVKLIMDRKLIILRTFHDNDSVNCSFNTTGRGGVLEQFCLQYEAYCIEAGLRSIFPALSLQ